MIREDCLYYEKCNDMGATIDWCRNYPHLNFDCEKCERYIEENFVSVVWCKDCKYFDHSDFGKGEEYWCKHFVSVYDITHCHKVTEDDYCSWGERREDGEIQHPQENDL